MNRYDTAVVEQRMDARGWTRVGGDLYQDKPPLFFWMLALCYTLFGSFKGWFLLPPPVAPSGPPARA